MASKEAAVRIIMLCIEQPRLVSSRRFSTNPIRAKYEAQKDRLKNQRADEAIEAREFCCRAKARHLQSIWCGPQLWAIQTEKHNGHHGGIAAST